MGDSTAILALKNPLAEEPNQHPVKAMVLTKDHKPEDPDETRNIENLGETLENLGETLVFDFYHCTADSVKIIGGMWEYIFPACMLHL